MIPAPPLTGLTPLSNDERLAAYLYRQALQGKYRWFRAWTGLINKEKIMGEMADYALGCLSDIEENLFDQGGTLSCNYCGVPELHWRNFGYESKPKWRLVDAQNAIHHCDDKKRAINSAKRNRAQQKDKLHFVYCMPSNGGAWYSGSASTEAEITSYVEFGAIVEVLT